MSPEGDPGREAGDREFPPRARALLEELRGLLQSIYAEVEVPRAKVQAVAQRGRALAAEEGAWPGGREEAEEFLSLMEALARKISQLLDLKKLKEQGLVKTVKF